MRLGVALKHCSAVKDSANGIYAAAATAMHVFAYANQHHAPDAE